MRDRLRFASLTCVLLAASACKSDEAPKTSAAASTAVAGTVLDVKGSVSVAGKPLAKGDTVTADAMIDTGADSSVTILLAHNDVKLELGANKHVRVNESIAWKAPKRVEPGAGPDDSTESAGRPAERNAAETSVTAMAPQAAVEVAPSSDAKADRDREEAKAKADSADAEKVAPKAAKQKKAAESARNDALGGADGGGGLGLTGTGEGGGGTATGGIGLGGIGTIGHGGGTGQGAGYGAGNGRLGGGGGKAPTVTQGKAEVSGALPADVIRRIVRANIPRIRYCYEKGLTKNPELAGKLNVKFTIGKDGAVVSAETTGSTIGDAEVLSCAANVFKQMSFPSPEGGGVVTVTYPMVFAPAK